MPLLDCSHRQGRSQRGGEEITPQIKPDSFRSTHTENLRVSEVHVCFCVSVHTTLSLYVHMLPKLLISLVFWTHFRLRKFESIQLNSRTDLSNTLIILLTVYIEFFLNFYLIAFFSCSIPSKVTQSWLNCTNIGKGAPLPNNYQNVDWTNGDSP